MPDFVSLFASTVTPPSFQKRPGTLTRMPDDEQDPQRDGVFGVFSGYGIVSAVLAVVAVAAAVLAALIWTQHRGDTDELPYRTQVLQAAADWTDVLINMNKDTVAADLNTLHEGTVGQLNSDFETIVEPYRKLVQTLRASTTGQIDSVALDRSITTSPTRKAHRRSRICRRSRPAPTR